MKNLILSLFVLVSVFGFSQNKYDFDIPGRAKNDVGVFDWYIDKLDGVSDSLLYKMFEISNTQIDSIHWEYSTDLIYKITEFGDTFCSKNVYSVNNKDKKIEFAHIYDGLNNLDNKYYTLIYHIYDGITYMWLIEYF